MDGFGLPDQIAARLKELGQTACGIADHGTVAGWIPFYNTMRKNGIQPVLGMEAYQVPNRKAHVHGVKSRGAKSPEGAHDIAHLTLFAKNQTGYRNLLQLFKLSHAEGFYRKPTVDWDDVIAHQAGLIVMTGCVGGMIPSFLYAGRHERAFNLDSGRNRAAEYLAFLKERIECLYVEITPSPGLPISTTACRELWSLAKQLEIPLVLSDDAHFPRPDDHVAEDTLVCTQTHQQINSSERKLKISHHHFHCSGEEVVTRVRTMLPSIPVEEIEDAARMSALIAATCQVEIPKPKGPLFQVPEGLTADWLLKKWVAEGVTYRRQLGLLPEDNAEEWRPYAERLDYEFQIIAHHGFANYFLLVSDLVRWSKEQNYWCIARGSCGGSLLCYVLGISQLDSIKHNLPVERFIDFSRSDLPDIDLDFDTRHRDAAFRYLEGKYGKEHCAQIAALSTFRSKQALNDVAKVHGIPHDVVLEVLKHLPEVDAEEGIKARGRLEHLFQSEPVIQQLLKQYPALNIAASLEGQIRQSSIHAAGFIVDSSPLAEIGGVITQKDGTRILACDMQQAAAQGFLKIDALSVEMLSTISEVLEAIGRDHDWLYRLSLDDAPTYALLGAGCNQGVFQMKGHTAGKLLVQLQPSNFNDLVALMALARPGPLQSGGAQEYIDRKHGRAPEPRHHPAIAAVLDETHGVILYQEQVMALMREVGGFDWPDVHKIRKLVSKSGGATAMNHYYEPFMESALAKGIGEEEAEGVWLQCQRAGNYIFNKAHGAAYALVGYWSAYLKCHHPALFACIAANHESKEEYQRQILREFQANGGTLKLLDPNRSGVRFKNDGEGVILGGFANIKGIGETLAQKLVDSQPFRGWTHFLTACPANVARDLHATGVSRGELDLDTVLALAPWCANVEFLDNESAAFERMRCIPCAEAREMMREGRPGVAVRLLARITDLAISVGKHSTATGDNERCGMTLTDPSGSVDVWFSGWRWSEVKNARSPLKGGTEGLGNTVYVVATLSKDRTRFWGEDAILFRESQAQIDPKTKKLIAKESRKALVTPSLLSEDEE